MNIGQLKHRIEIWGFTEERDEYGGIGGQWVKLATRWAKIEQCGGSEVSDGNQVKAVGSIKIIMRYIPFLTEKHRIKFDKNFYEIKSVYDTDTGRYMTVVNCEVVKDGV